jgi:hypothetical protein
MPDRSAQRRSAADRRTSGKSPIDEEHINHEQAKVQAWCCEPPFAQPPARPTGYE